MHTHAPAQQLYTDIDCASGRHPKQLRVLRFVIRYSYTYIHTACTHTHQLCTDIDCASGGLPKIKSRLLRCVATYTPLLPHHSLCVCSFGLPAKFISGCVSVMSLPSLPALSTRCDFYNDFVGVCDASRP